MISRRVINLASRSRKSSVSLESRNIFRKLYDHTARLPTSGLLTLTSQWVKEGVQTPTCGQWPLGCSKLVREQLLSVLWLNTLSTVPARVAGRHPGFCSVSIFALQLAGCYVIAAAPSDRFLRCLLWVFTGTPGSWTAAPLLCTPDSRV